MGTGVPVTFKITVSCMLAVEQHIVEQYVYPLRSVPGWAYDPGGLHFLWLYSASP